MTLPPSTTSLPFPTSLSEIILPSHPSLSQTLTSLRKSRLSIHNRLTSINLDSEFVSTISTLNTLPLIPNERCGSWYVNPSLKKGSAYFKSTDGHAGQWKFSLRRLNLDLLAVLGHYGGAVLVDATRRGKSMPDAISRTVPIWVAVLNRVLFPEVGGCHGLCMPEGVVSWSERGQIEGRLGGFVEGFKSLELDLARLRMVVGKPIRVSFITRQTSVLKVQRSTEYRTLICCSASRLEKGDGDGYVQGAGDDIEHWANGLKAHIFWSNKDLLLNEHSDEKLSLLIDRLVQQDSGGPVDLIHHVHLKTIPTSLFIGKSASWGSLNTTDYRGIIFCDPPALDLAQTKEALKSGLSLLDLGCSPGKLGGQTLRKKLPLIDSFILSTINKSSAAKMLVLCSSGKDLSVGVALAILCRYVGDDGKFRSEALGTVDKNFIRQRLACLMSIIPEANPSRATLQSVNTYLMSQDR